MKKCLLSASVAVGLLSFTSPAYADSITPDDLSPVPASVQTVVPPCVSSTHEGDSVSVFNTCEFELRVKVLVAHGPDSSCHTLAPYQSFSFDIEGFPWDPMDPQFDGLERC